MSRPRRSAVPARAGAVDAVLDAATPAAGAVVMGTGIVSVALWLDGDGAPSAVLLVIAVLMWGGLAALVPLRARRDRARFATDLRTPAALTAVAGTAVVGTRLAMVGWRWAGVATLALAAVTWAALAGPVLVHWRTPTVGASLLLTVATESLAVLAALLAPGERADWLLMAAIVPFVLGLCFYAFTIARFDLRQLTVGRGDHWITGGALAISTLAAGKLLAGATVLAILGGERGVLKGLALGLWGMTTLWLPVLLLGELLRPRLRYDISRWSTVFPLGMYAACSFVVGSAAHAGAITSVARFWIWIALAAWVVVLVATIRAGLRAAR